MKNSQAPSLQFFQSEPATDQNRIRVRELSARIKAVIDKNFSFNSLWVEGEVMDLKYQFQSDNYYFLLIDKDDQSDKVLASVKATIWKNNSQQVHQFQKKTGYTFSSGLKVMLRCFVSYHAVYGFSVNVVEINPEYTVGSLALSRQHTIDQLILNLKGVLCKNGQYYSPNKIHKLPRQIKTIALLTATGSDAYLDFMHEITSTKDSIAYTIVHHPIQLGAEAIPRLRNVLMTIASNPLYQAIVIVRGGGSDSEMLAFDSYELSKLIAEYPIPVIIGVGHERNLSVCDLLSNVSVKTPTKAANFINDHNLRGLNEVANTLNSIVELTKKRILDHEQKISVISNSMRSSIDKFYTREIRNTDSLLYRIKEQTINTYHHNLLQVEKLASKIAMFDPDFYLSRGYALITKNKHIVTSAQDLKLDDTISITLKDGEIKAKIY